MFNRLLGDTVTVGVELVLASVDTVRELGGDVLVGKLTVTVLKIVLSIVIESNRV